MVSKPANTVSETNMMFFNKLSSFFNLMIVTDSKSVCQVNISPKTVTSRLNEADIVYAPIGIC